MRNYRVLGLMSGSSMDGIDCGIFNIMLSKDYRLKWECIDFCTIPFSNSTRSNILKVIIDNNKSLSTVDRMIGEVIANSAKLFLKDREIDLVAMHGQTISHIDGKSSTQIGNPQIIYNVLKVPVIFNLREADINAGGNGAPLMPFLDWLLFKEKNSNIITLNIGGIANISLIPENSDRDKVIGFDTGPGMSLIDESCYKFYDETLDRNGIHANNGYINNFILNELMQKKFINKKPPKSTGRDEFGIGLINKLLNKYPDVSPDDYIRTFCMFTAKSIAKNIKLFLNFDKMNSYFIISGGGVNHPTLINDIKNCCNIRNIMISTKVGIDPNMKEALLMAVLGVARVEGISSNMMNVTGADKLVVLGSLII